MRYALGIAFGLLVLVRIGVAEETVVRQGSLPFAALSQEITYSTTQKDYLEFRDRTLAELKKGNFSVAKNTPDTPYMRVETTATVGIEYKGIGTADGRKHLRQVTASEEALLLFEKWEQEQGNSKKK